MAMVTLTSQTLPFEHNNSENLRDVSFSSYLASSDEAFVRKLAESSREIGSKITTEIDQHDYLGSKKDEDGEIGVFGAEKYFNGGMDEQSPRMLKKSLQSNWYVRNARADVKPVQLKLLPGTPSVQSESNSSWNSQSALLQAVLPRNPSQSKSNKGQEKSFLSNFGCRCFCYDKDSFKIEETVTDTGLKRSAYCEVVNKAKPAPKALVIKTSPKVDSKISEPRFREDSFSFPTTNSITEIDPYIIPFQTEQELAEMERKSIEVFGSPALDKRNRSFHIEKRLSMMSWESKETGYSKGKCSNDMDSDASSDLFEIESLTGKNSPFLAREASSDAASCYAPSEASIEWSVVTASAAEYSVISDHEELRSATTAMSPRRTFPASKNRSNNSQIPRRGASSLLGCKSQKAVRVAGDAFLTNERVRFEPGMRRAADSYMPTTATRFQADPKMGGLDYRKRQQAFASRSITGSDSPRASPLLYIR